MTEEESRQPRYERPRPRPGRLRRWVLRPAIWLVVIVVILAAILLWILHLPRFQQSLVIRYLPLLEERLGRVVEVGEVKVRLLPLAVEARGLRLAGPRIGDPDVATLDRIYADIDLPSLWRRSLQLDGVEIDGLTVFLERLGDDDNLPSWSRRGTRTPRNEPMRVTLGTLVVRNSSVRFEEIELPLAVSAQGIEATLLGRRGVSAAGTFGVEHVELDLNDGRLIASLGGRIAVDSEKLTFDAAHLQGADSRLTVDGTVAWKGDRRIALEVAGEVSARLAQDLNYLDDQVEGRATIDSSFEWRPEAWGFRAELEAPRLQLLEDWQAEEVKLRVVGDPNGVWADLLEAGVAGGQIAGRYELDLAGESSDASRGPDASEPSAPRTSSLDVEWTGVALPVLFETLQWPVDGVEGLLDGELSYRFLDSAWADGSGWGTGRIRGARGRSAGEKLEFTGPVPFTIEGGNVRANAARLVAPEQQLLASVFYDLDRRVGQVEASLQSEALAPIAVLIPGSDDPDSPALWMPGEGSGQIDAVVELSPSGIDLRIDLDLVEFDAPGLTADRVRGHLELRDDVLENLRLEFSRASGAGLMTGRIPLQSTDGLSLGIEATGWPLSDVAAWLPLEVPLIGDFQGEVTLQGLGEDVVGRVDGMLANSVAYGLPLGDLSARFGWDGEALTLDNARVPVGEGSIEVSGGLRFETGALDLVLQAERVDLAALPRAEAPSMAGSGSEETTEIAGHLWADGRIGGTTQTPRVDLEVSVADMVVNGAPLGSGEASLTWDEGRIGLDLQAGEWLRARGEGSLDDAGSDLELTFRLDDLTPLQPLLFSEDIDFGGGLRGRAHLGGDRAFAVDRAEVTVDQADFRLSEQALHLLEPAVLVWTAERLEIESVYLGEPRSGGESFLSGTVGLTGARPLDLRIQASVAADWAELFVPGVGLTGQIDALGSVRGTLEAPAPRAQAGITEGRLRFEGLTQSLEELEGVVLLDPDAIVIDGLEARLGAGQIRAGGRLDWPSEAAPLIGRIQLALDEATVHYPEGMNLRGSGEVVWTGAASGQSIRGLVTFDRARYLQDLDIDFLSLVQSFLRRRPDVVATTDESLERIALNIALRAPASVRIDNNVADIRASADLNLRGTLARPVVFGAITSEDESSLVYAGNEYEIERAVITFANPYRMEPLIDVEASTKVAAYDVSVGLFGNLERLEVTLSSDPPLPDAEVLGLLLGGRPGDPNQRASEETKTTAESLLYGQATSYVGKRVGELLGFDSLRVEPLSTSGRSLSNARVSVGKRLSSRLFATYSYDPSSTANQQIQLEWQVSDTLLVRVTQDDESYAVDLLWENSF